jgi:hypothetical protein
MTYDKRSARLARLSPAGTALQTTAAKVSEKVIGEVSPPSAITNCRSVAARFRRLCLLAGQMADVIAGTETERPLPPDVLRHAAEVAVRCINEVVSL